MITTTETADKTDGTSSDEGLRPEPNETDSSKGSDRDEKNEYNKDASPLKLSLKATLSVIVERDEEVTGRMSNRLSSTGYYSPSSPISPTGSSSLSWSSLSLKPLVLEAIRPRDKTPDDKKELYLTDANLVTPTEDETEKWIPPDEINSSPIHLETGQQEAMMKGDLGEELPQRPKSFFGCRHVFGFMGFLGLAAMYLMRTNLSVAIVDMINTNASSFTSSNRLNEMRSTNGSDFTCPYEEDATSSDQTNDGEFNWDSTEKGQVLGAFFWGYIVTQIPGGILAERFGGKWVIGIGVLLCDLLCLISPVAARYGGSLALTAVRILTGLTQGVMIPAMTSMISKWVPSMEKTTIGAFVLSGTLFGTVLSFPLSGWLCALDFDNGWPLSFYVPGSIGLVWLIGWSFLVYDSPSVHPRITDEEKRYILATAGQGKTRPMSATPWSSILTSIRVWAIVVAHFGQNWGYSVLITQLPSYMKSILHFDIKTNGLLSSLPYVIMWIFSFICSITADFLRRREILSTTATRKLFSTIGLFLPACGLLGATFTGCDRMGTVVLLSLSSGFNGANNSGFYVSYIDVTSNFAGSLMGVSQTVANSCGFIVPAVVGAIVTNEESLKEWQTIFLISAGIYIAANIFYLIFGTGVEQPWNRVSERKSLPLKAPVLSVNSEIDSLLVKHKN